MPGLPLLSERGGFSHVSGPSPRGPSPIQRGEKQCSPRHVISVLLCQVPCLAEEPSREVSRGGLGAPWLLRILSAVPNCSYINEHLVLPGASRSPSSSHMLSHSAPETTQCGGHCSSAQFTDDTVAAQSAAGHPGGAGLHTSVRLLRPSVRRRGYAQCA